VPLGYSLAELSLPYSALLGRTPFGTPPGETSGCPPDSYAWELPIALEADGVVKRDQDGECTFSIGEEARRTYGSAVRSIATDAIIFRCPDEAMYSAR
jgi:hypothetical protein